MAFFIFFSLSFSSLRRLCEWHLQDLAAFQIGLRNTSYMSFDFFTSLICLVFILRTQHSPIHGSFDMTGLFEALT